MTFNIEGQEILTASWRSVSAAVSSNRIFVYDIDLLVD